MSKIEIFYEGALATRSVHLESGAEIFTEAPKDNQGRGGCFSPTDLLATALGSCLLTILGIKAQNLGVDISGSKVSIDKEMSSDLPRRISKIQSCFVCPRAFTPEIQEKLEKAARQCPVHHSLHPEVQQEFLFSWGTF